MKRLIFSNFAYTTGQQQVRFFSRFAPSLVFYLKFIWIVIQSSFLAKRGVYGGGEWGESSYKVLTKLEEAGVHFSFSGLEHVERLEEPCVFIGNHMSMMETLILPSILQPIREITFVIKESLLHYPVFKHIMRSCNPIAVTREHPREDLKRVMAGGKERLVEGVSIVVFPQTTRSGIFDSKQFSSIGIKLAKKAKVPVVPMAVKTDAWENGKYLKDFGPLNASKKVHISFGEPLKIQGKGTEEHQEVIQFIKEKLRKWNSEAYN